MNKSLHLYFVRCCLIICCLTTFSKVLHAQTDADGQMIPKNFFCGVVMYDHSSWNNYWEGTFKRNNLNIGTLTANTYSVMGNYGISNKLDFLFTVPYITTNASGGTLAGQKGFQDLNISLKWHPYQTKIGKGAFGLYAVAAASTPTSNYEPNFLPVSIGLHSTTASLRVLANYQTGRFFVAGAGQYIYRSNITIDADAYYTTREIYSNRVYMPDVTNFLFSTGYRSVHFNAEAIISQTTTHGGFDIRKNDMPFPSNEMNMTTAGVLFKYSFDAVAGLELTAGGNRVLDGRNVGQSTDFFGGVLYLFDFSKNNKK
ncbi:MAG: hypothetical protein JWQ84_1319 [Mucilaginibacter sp.]|jgi:hypothetical protein|nr:hypothetical protein [Mucilaginibacter sp.]MDB5139364.1 hypothetical protein [Mucilaginibacter sp.]